MSLNGLRERQVDPRPLALTRIVVGLAALMLAVVKFVRLRGIAADGLYRQPVVEWLPDPSPLLAGALCVAWMALAVGLIVGFRARAAAMGVACAGALAMVLDLQMYSNHLTLMVVLCVLLGLGQPAAAWSVDARRGDSRPTIAYWPVFLIQVQITTVYAYAALSKLNGTFLSGDVLQSFLRPPLSEAGDGLIMLAAWGTVAAELFLAGALWSSRMRPLALPVGLGLHAGIVVGGSPVAELVPFGMLMLGTYVLFGAVAPASRLVVWDDGCAFCARSVAVLRRLDAFRVHRFIGSSDRTTIAAAGVTAAEADRAVQLVGPRERAQGFAAIRMVAEASPMTFLVAPLLRQWPIPAIGERLYARVASRRSCGLDHVPPPTRADRSSALSDAPPEVDDRSVAVHPGPVAPSIRRSVVSSPPSEGSS